MSQTAKAKPKRVMYPTALIDRSTVRLQRDLRRLYRRFRRGELAAVHCMYTGEGLIKSAYGLIQVDVSVYLEKRGFRYPFNHSELEQALTDCLARWRHVVDDFSSVRAVSSAVDVGVCTCTEHKVLSAAEDAVYWLSYAGILRRIDGLSQDFMFRTVNGAMKMVAVSNGVEWMHWVTAGDDRVCQTCRKYAAGGQGGYYKVSWFMPVMPVHPGDRCQWEIVVASLPERFQND